MQNRYRFDEEWVSIHQSDRVLQLDLQFKNEIIMFEDKGQVMSFVLSCFFPSSQDLKYLTLLVVV